MLVENELNSGDLHVNHEVKVCRILIQSVIVTYFRCPDLK